MKLTPKIQKAINLAADKHLGQKRKGIELPYIVHPYSVAFILNDYTENEDIIVAGLLHDVLEDVKGYSYEDLEKDFGKSVAKIVKEVSEDKDPNVEYYEKATWEERKAGYLANLENDSEEALMITAADKIHNLQSMLNDYDTFGKSLWEKFNASKERKMWFYGEVVKVIKKRLKNDIVKELEDIYNIVSKLG